VRENSPSPPPERISRRARAHRRYRRNQRARREALRRAELEREARERAELARVVIERVELADPPPPSNRPLLNYQIAPESPPSSVPSISYTPVSFIESSSEPSSPDLPPPNSPVSPFFYQDFHDLPTPPFQPLRSPPPLGSHDLENQSPIGSPISESDNIEGEQPAASPAPSIQFLEEVPYLPPAPRCYFAPGPHQSFESVLSCFPLCSDPLPPGVFTIGPHGFDLESIRLALPHTPPDAPIYAYLPHTYLNYHLVPKLVFMNLFPPSSATVNEISS
jgi:hypothetical protein